MPYTIPNVVDAEDASQAQIDSRDFSDILAPAFNYTGVLSGCAVTAQGTPDMTVAVAAGTVVVNGTVAAVTAGNLTISANATGNARFDLICVDSAGVKSVVAGTAAASPVFPSPAGKVVLAAVRVPTGVASISAAKIVDKRVINTITSLAFGTTGDTNLYRASAQLLQTDSAFVAANGAGATGKILLGWAGGGYGVQIGGDTNLYRSAADTLKTDDSLTVAGSLTGLGNTTLSGWLSVGNYGVFYGSPTLYLRSDSAKINFGSADDTNLYRYNADVLKTDDGFLANYVQAAVGTSKQIEIGVDRLGGGQAAINFGSALDTNLYRAAADTLKTDDTFVATGPIYQDSGNYRTGVGFDPAASASPTTYTSFWYDTGAGRAVIASLSGGVAWRDVEIRNSRLVIGNSIAFGTGNANFDTNLYRAAAAVLKTDHKLQVMGNRGTGAVTAQARNSIEAWLSSASLISIGESVVGDANPAITLYRTSAGAASGSSMRMGHKGYIAPGRWTGVIFEAGSSSNYGSETYTQVFEIGYDGKLLFGADTGPPDTSLYRAGPNLLGTGGGFALNGYLYPGANMGGVFPALYSANGLGAAIGWNFSSGNAEVNFWNTYSSHALNAVPSFQFRQMTAAGASNALLSIGGDGSLLFGSAGDANLYRSAASNLKTDGTFWAGNAVVVDASNGANKLYLGGALDTYLYRAGARTFRTNSAFYYEGDTNGIGLVFSPATAAGNSLATYVGSEAAYRFTIDVNGRMGWGPGNAAADTNLYRNAADVLKTDDSFVVGGTITAGGRIFSGAAQTGGMWVDGGANQFVGSGPTAALMGLYNGGWHLQVSTAGQILLPAQGATAGLLIGTDTNLYRSSAGLLVTDTSFRARAAITWPTSATGIAYSTYLGGESWERLRIYGDGKLSWSGGTSEDTSLYRLGGNLLATPGAFNVDRGGTGARLQFGAAGDAYIYRYSGNVLATDGTFWANDLKGNLFCTNAANRVTFNWSGGRFIILIDGATVASFPSGYAP